MEKIQILSIGRDPVLLQKLSRFINENPRWESTATVDDETAIEIFHQRKFNLILCIDNIEEVSEMKFRSVFTYNDPDIMFLKHYGESTGLLAGEIQEVLDGRKKTVNMIDDVFKNRKEV